MLMGIFLGALAFGSIMTTMTVQAASGQMVVYTGHQQTYGNLAAQADGAALGTTGAAKRLEAVSIQKGQSLSNVDGSIEYRVHVQSYGTTGWVSDGTLAGTTGESKRIEAIQIRLTGELSEQYDIYYSVHVQKYGWTNWTKGLSDGEDASGSTGWCGTKGLSLRIESIKIVMVEKGGAAPTGSGSWSYLPAESLGTVVYSGHQQTFGNLARVTSGTVLGVTGQYKRMEAISISLTGNTVSGSISYRVHGQSYGWQDWASDGTLAGTTGQSKRMEAIEIKLSGEISKYYDVWYRVHVESYGWLGWAKNGQTAGTTGLSKRIEAIEIRLVPVAASTPGANSGYYLGTANASWVGYLDAAQTSSQIVLVSVYNTNYANVTMYVKENGDWKKYFSTTGRVGSAGIGKTREKDYKTPTGVYSLHTPFGILADPGCPLAYVQLTQNHYWGGYGSYYNKFVDISEVSDFNTWNAEHLITYGSVYNYCVAIGYNLAGVEGKGSAIFLHCSGKGATAGCVSIPESSMITVLQNLKSDAKIIIDNGDNVYNY